MTSARSSRNPKICAGVYGRVLRSPHAHARIVRIDASKALALDGVKAVVTNADFPRVEGDMVDLGETFAPFKWVRDNVLASDKALYAGHAVAAVCATDPHVAEDALGLIEVEYELLPPVLSVHQAMAEGAPLVHETLRTTEMAARFVPGDERSESPSNTASHLRFELGDVEQGFADAEIVLEREFETATAHQGYLEAHNGRDDESAAASGHLVTGECDAGLVRGLGLTRIMAGAWAA